MRIQKASASFILQEGMKARQGNEMKVFMSCGSTFTDTQKAFVEELERFLQKEECVPHTVGKSSFSAIQPIRHARDVIQECDGAVVVAFERYRIEKGLEKPESKDEGSIDGWKLPTPWNQLEAAMAYGMELPLFIVVERGLKRQGMIGDRHEWYAQEIELSKDYLKTI